MATGRALDAGPITGCDETLTRLNLCTHDLLQLKNSTEAICQYFEREMPNLKKVEHTARTFMQNFQNDIDSLTDSYEFLKNQLLSSRRTVSGVRFRNSAS